MSVGTIGTTMEGAGHVPGGEPRRDPPRDVLPVREPMTFARQAATIREMLSTLETLTSAGQRHTMSKIASFVGRHARDGRHDLTPRNGDALADLSGWLRREAERAAPDVASFSRRTEDVLALLATLV